MQAPTLVSYATYHNILAFYQFQLPTPDRCPLSTQPFLAFNYLICMPVCSEIGNYPFEILNKVAMNKHQAR